MAPNGADTALAYCPYSSPLNPNMAKFAHFQNRANDYWILTRCESKLSLVVSMVWSLVKGVSTHNEHFVLCITRPVDGGGIAQSVTAVLL